MSIYVICTLILLNLIQRIVILITKDHSTINARSIEMNLSILALQRQNWLAILDKTHFWPWCIILHTMILDFVPHEITKLPNFSKLTCTAHSQRKPWNIFISLAVNNTSHKSADVKDIMILILSTSLEAYIHVHVS